MTTTPLVIVAGAGPGLGAALLKRFAAGGYRAVGLTRTLWDSDGLDAELIRADLSCAKQVLAGVQQAVGRHGPPAVVIHNTAQLVIKPFLESHSDDFEATWRSMVLSATHVSRAVLPLMLDNKGGVLLFSGATASLRGGANFAAFASAKFALRGLAQSLAREFQGQGIHVGHIILDGIVDNERSRQLHGMAPARMMSPEDIAEAYWQLAHQGKSAWSHEIDLRPMAEKF